LIVWYLINFTKFGVAAAELEDR